MSATELRDRLAGQVAVLELIDRRREREGPSIGSAVEQRIVDEALVAVESATRDGLSAVVPRKNPSTERLG